tara:strand:- start:33 stop:944 length:912 start_codon:yes stop_codon:yes gene_type:complete
MKAIQHIALLAAGLLAVFSATAAIEIDTVQVGNKGNANDSTSYGGVVYDYHIGTYEVTNSQYTAFLNATAATDTHSLYNSSMGINRAGSSGSYTYSEKSGFGDKPVFYVGFWDAARFSNWLTTGGTETGVYNLNETTTPHNNTITRDATAWANGGVAVASENEWYKAAYYDGNGGYTLNPTQSNSITTDDANYGNSVGSVTDVGTYAATSYYGTFDQGGNLWEWNDTIVSTSDRGLRGGSFKNNANTLQSSFRLFNNPTIESNFIGFRVSSLAPIPEPSAYAAILGCLGLALALMRRKGRGTF